MQWQEMSRGPAEASPVANASGSGENQTSSKNEESIGRELDRPSILNWVSVSAFWNLCRGIISQTRPNTEGDVQPDQVDMV